MLESKQQKPEEGTATTTTTTTPTTKIEKMDGSKLSKAKGLYIDFIAPNAVHDINISSKTREVLAQWYYEATNPSSPGYTKATQPETLQSLFTDVQREIFELMCADSLLRFQSTAGFHEISNAFNSKYFFEGASTQASKDSDLSTSRPLSPSVRNQDVEHIV